jgi:CRISPR type III-associated protein (TIGR04423 family)
MKVNIYNSLDAIPSLNFDGYIWMSDSNEPIMLFNEKYNFGPVSNNPFIVEALLFNEELKTSIHILHQGEYVISEYILEQSSLEKVEEIEYLPHRLKNVNKVLFKQIWEEQADENCHNFPVYSLKATVFSGFKKI